MKIILPCLLVLTLTSAFAQDRDDYVVLHTNDTLYGRVEHIDLDKINPQFYEKIRFTDSHGKKKRYKRKEVSAFRSDGSNYEAFWLNQTSKGIQLINPEYNIDERTGTLYFLRVMQKGKLSHYLLEWWEQGDSSSWWMDLLIKEDDAYFIRATQGLLGLKKKVLTHYFQDCPELSKRIQKIEITRVYDVVEFFNEYCVD